eukprot:GHVS01048772.1.p1 GENE.GHVS01048772.1~~GHVS01048772.1.p1  ORF type:complete len:947 (+),score=190.56 GHVS01048772.1:877-3717(+)
MGGGVGSLLVELSRALPLAYPLVDGASGRLEEVVDGLFGVLNVWDGTEVVWGPQRLFCHVAEVAVTHRTKPKSSRRKLQRLGLKTAPSRRRLMAAMAELVVVPKLTSPPVAVVGAMTVDSSLVSDDGVKTVPSSSGRQLTVKVHWYIGNTLIVDSAGNAIVAHQSVSASELLEVSASSSGHKPSEAGQKPHLVTDMKLTQQQQESSNSEGVDLTRKKQVEIKKNLSGKLQRRSENIKNAGTMRSALAYKEFKTLLDKQHISRVTAMKSDVTCGDHLQGFTVPRGMEQFTSRLSDHLGAIQPLQPPLQSAPPLSSAISLASPVIRWSSLAANLGVPVVQDGGIKGRSYRGADLRYLMPKFDVDVREDGPNFDVFLFAPEPPLEDAEPLSITDSILRTVQDGISQWKGLKVLPAASRRGVRVDGQRLFRMSGAGLKKGGGNKLATPSIVGLPTTQQQQHGEGSVDQPLDDSTVIAPPARLLLEGQRMMRDSLVGELSVKDAITGDVVYGPVEMNCPYAAVPVEAVRVTPLMFEVKLKTLEHGVIGDELQQPLIVKRWVFRHKAKKEKTFSTLETESDKTVENSESDGDGDDGDESDKTEDIHKEKEFAEIIGDADTLSLSNKSNTSRANNKCSGTMLGLRALDVDFDFFEKTTEMQSFVRSKLAKSLSVEREDINICQSKEGSTILAFDAGEGLSNRWTEVLNNPASQIHDIFQVDPFYPPTVSKSQLQAMSPPGTSSSSSSLWQDQLPLLFPPPQNGDPQTHPDFSFDPLPFPVSDSIVLNPDGNRYTKDTFVPLPHQVGKGVPPPPTLQGKGEHGVPGWLWGLVVLSAVVFVGGVAALSVLMVVAKRKAAERQNAGGSAVADAGGPVASLPFSRGASTSAWGDAGTGVVSTVVGGRPVKVGKNKIEDYSDMERRWDGGGGGADSYQVDGWGGTVEYEQDTPSVRYA